MCVRVCVCVNKLDCSVKKLKCQPHYNVETGVNVKIILKTERFVVLSKLVWLRTESSDGILRKVNEHSD